MHNSKLLLSIGVGIAGAFSLGVSNASAQSPLKQMQTEAGRSAAAPNRASQTISGLQTDKLIDQIDGLRLVENKVYLYRQAADALSSKDKARATGLLLRALTAIDSAETNLREERIPDTRKLAELAFTRRPVILQLVRVNQSEGLRVLEQPQAADSDTEFQRLVFEQVAPTDLDAVGASALRKLSHGATPAAVAAYAVLRQREPAEARVLATDIVASLDKPEAPKDRQAVQAAFALLRLLRTDEGTRAKQIVIDQLLLDDSSIHALFSFIADAFLTAKEPEMLVLPESPAIYVQAVAQYAPAKADDVKALPFAAPDAQSIIFSKAKIEDPTIPDVASLPALTAEQQNQRAQAQDQFLAQVRETAAQVTRAKGRLGDTSLSPEQLDKVIATTIDEANKSIALGRSFAALLQPAAFREGEYEFSNQGPLTGVVASVTNLLEDYARAHPAAAARAAERLDGAEIQMAVELSLALKAGQPLTTQVAATGR